MSTTKLGIELQRPLVFFDLETTGVNVSSDRIVEISLVKVYPDGHVEELCQRINPGRPIPAEATAVHHISDKDVADKPSFEQEAARIAALFENSDIAGFNSNRFDIPMLCEEFQRVGIPFSLQDVKCIDVQTIFHKKEPRTLVAAYKFYCGKNLEDAHSASADTLATYEVFKAQLDKYGDLPKDIDGLAEYTGTGKGLDVSGKIAKDSKGSPVINFGKYRGVPVEMVYRKDPDYINWMMNGDFPSDTKSVLKRIINSVN